MANLRVPYGIIADIDKRIEATPEYQANAFIAKMQRELHEQRGNNMRLEADLKRVQANYDAEFCRQRTAEGDRQIDARAISQLHEALSEQTRENTKLRAKLDAPETAEKQALLNMNKAQAQELASSWATVSRLGKELASQKALTSAHITAQLTAEDAVKALRKQLEETRKPNVPLRQRAAQLEID